MKTMKNLFVALLGVLMLCACQPKGSEKVTYPWQNTRLKRAERVENLLGIRSDEPSLRSTSVPNRPSVPHS